MNAELIELIHEILEDKNTVMKGTHIALLFKHVTEAERALKLADGLLAKARVAAGVAP